MQNPIIYSGIEELLTLEPAFRKGARSIVEQDLGLTKKACLIVDNGKILWVGQRKAIPRSLFKLLNQAPEVKLHVQTVLPGFVECHTHCVFAGHRAGEFEMRNQGVSYQEIAARGGGILSTMRKTRADKKDNLVRRTQSFVDDFISQGVTTLESKSGYCLDLKNEIKSLEVLHRMNGVRIVPTFLGAHAKPPEFKTHGQYLDFLVSDVLPVLQKRKLTRRVDIFIEKGFFEKDQALLFLQKAKEMGFDLVLHADQLSLSGGADLAVQLQALSADHLIRIQKKQIKSLARSETTAVLLPSADLYMKCPYPPARQLIDAGARVALATDFNPGSSPTRDLMLVGLLARLEMKMTLPEVISAYTLGPAFALGLQNHIGSLSPGKRADFISTNKSWQELFYSAGERAIEDVFLEGELTFKRS